MSRLLEFIYNLVLANLCIFVVINPGKGLANEVYKLTQINSLESDTFLTLVT